MPAPPFTKKPFDVELRDRIDRGRLDPAAVVSPLHPEHVGPDIRSPTDAVAGIADDDRTMAEGKVLRAVLAVAAEGIRGPRPVLGVHGSVIFLRVAPPARRD